jgi:tungstate transport system substrate-binding protein
VHAPGAELKFVKDGFGTDREAVMHNDFVLIGPQSNPAYIAIDQPITSALQSVSQTQAVFISRGDDSGTHKKELSLWQQASITPTQPWYLEVGQGMGAVITMYAPISAWPSVPVTNSIYFFARSYCTCLCLAGLTVII